MSQFDSIERWHSVDADDEKCKAVEATKGSGVFSQQLRGN
jgi:hypothetical protein